MMATRHTVGVHNVRNPLAVTVRDCGPSATTASTSDWATRHHRRNAMRPSVLLPTAAERSSNYAGREFSCCYGRSLGRRDLTFNSVVPTRNLRSADLIKPATICHRLLEGELRHMGRGDTLCRSKSGAEQDESGGIQRAQGEDHDGEGEQPIRFGQLVCWALAAIYVGWLFILPYAPGDPVWAITPSTIQLITEQSLNFFYVLPFASILANAAGYHGLSAPVQHPMAEALFNLVIGWTLLFGPLLFTDRRRDRFGWSLEALWIIQMFLTNTVLAPYMAIRQNNSPAQHKTSEAATPLKTISKGLVSGAYYVGVVGALVGAVSILWGVVGRPGAGFGSFLDRWDFLSGYVRQERLAYAFVWDFILYAGFQPWLIGDNLENVRAERRGLVRTLRAVPYVGLVAYVLSLEISQDQNSIS